MMLNRDNVKPEGSPPLSGTRWPADPEVRELHMEFVAKFQTLVEELGDEISTDSAIAGMMRVEHLVVASGTFDDPIAIAANYPTYVCSRMTYSSIIDMSNPCIRILAKVLGGLSGVFFFDYNPLRFNRKGRRAYEQPWKLMHQRFKELFAWYCDESMLRWKGRVLLLTGEEQLHRYRKLRPNAQPFSLEGQPVMWSGLTHGFVERGDNGEIHRIAILVYHMEHWLRGMSLPGKLHTEAMFSAALALAYPGAPVTVTVPVNARGTNIGTRFNLPPRSGESNVIAESASITTRYPVLAEAVRTLYIEQQTGITIPYDDLDDSLKPYYHPPTMDLEPTLPDGYAYRTRIIRGLLSCDDPVGFDIERAYKVLDADFIADMHNDSFAFYASNLWPMLCRIFKETGLGGRDFSHVFARLVKSGSSKLVNWQRCLSALILVSGNDIAMGFSRKSTHRLPPSTLRYNSGVPYTGMSDEEELARDAVKYLNWYAKKNDPEKRQLRNAYNASIRFARTAKPRPVAGIETWPDKIRRLQSECAMARGTMSKRNVPQWIRLQKARIAVFAEQVQDFRQPYAKKMQGKVASWNKLLQKLDQRFR